MAHLFGSLVLQVLAEVDNSEVLAHVLVSDISHPPGDSGGEQANLKLVLISLFHTSEDLVDIFLKSELEHLIGFIENNRLNATEIDVASLKMVKDTTSSTNEEIDSTSEISGLVLDRHSTVDSKSTVFRLMMLQSTKFSRNLNNEIALSRVLVK
jgi:hypothetical protein